MIRRYFLYLSVMTLSVAISGCFDPYAAQRQDSTNKIANAESFIWAAASGNEDKAYSLLSNTTQQAVTDQCPNGSVVECFNEFGRSHWGTLEMVVFDYGNKNNSVFTTVWGNSAIWIVIQSSKKNGRWAVDAWRGGIKASGEWPEGLLEGTNPINQFPPVAATATESPTPVPTSEPLPEGARAAFTCNEAITGIAYSPDGSTIAAIGQDGITICDVKTTQVVKVLEADHLTSTQPAWSPDGRLIAGASAGAKLHIWNVASGEMVNSILVTFADEGSETEGYHLYGIAWSPDGTRIAAGDGAAASSLRIWDSASGERLLTIGEYHIAEVAWSADGKQIAGGSLLGEVVVWDAATGEEVGRNGEPYTPSVGSFGWSPDGSRMAVGLLPYIVIYDTSTGEEITRLIADETGSFMDVAWSPDGSLLAVTLPDVQQMWLWDTSTWEQVAIIEMSNELWSAAWSPDGKTIATRVGDSTIVVWAVDQLVQK